MSISPTVEGFRAAFRRPALTLAEITWRWTTGATAAALLIFGLFEYLGTLQVTNGELLFLRTRHPYLVGEAIAHILRGSLNRAVVAALVAALMLTALWIVAASVGRIATVRGLLDYFRRDAPSNASPTESSLPALLRLNFLRAALALAAVLGFGGAGIAAGFVSPVAHPAPGTAFSLFLLLAGMICYLWSAFNWLLSLASVFAVRDGQDAGGAIAAAVDFCREHFRAVFAVSTWAGLAHLAALVGASTMVAMPLGFAGILPWRLIVAGIIIATLGYFALADWLYMARLAGYICITETPEALLAPPPNPLPATGPPVQTMSVQTTPVQTTIDRDERILSDLSQALFTE